MDWLSLILGVAIGIILNWFIYGYLLFKRIDILWEYARSLDRTVNGHTQMLHILADWTNFVGDKEYGADEVSNVPEDTVQ